MKCKHTEDGHGYYIKLVYSYRQYYTADGEPTGTDDGVNGRSRGGKIAYCDHCNARLGRVGTLKYGVHIKTTVRK